VLAINLSRDFLGKCATVEEIQQRRDLVTAWGKRLALQPQVECPVTNRFAGGLYLREIFMPAGSFVIGKIHSTQHFNIIVSGECLIATTDGVKHVRAPYTFISEPGVQKCVLNLTDVLWQTTHVTDSKDPEEIVESLTVCDYADLDTDFAINELLGEHV